MSSSPLLALVRSWAIGLTVLLVSAYLLRTTVTDPFGPPGRDAPFISRLMLLHLPSLACALLATLAAARTHRPPHRDSPAPHVLASLAAPLAVHAVTLAGDWSRATAEDIAAPTLAVLMGCAIAVALDLSMEERTG
ncbi:hypothetical protein ACWCP6_05475 [Streptomyces sp. NPDC002004]